LSIVTLQFIDIKLPFTNGGRVLRKGLLVIFSLVALACSTKPAQTAATDPAADEAAIKAAAATWFDLYNKGDIEGVTGLYSDDAIVFADANPAAVGKDAIRTFLTKDIGGAQAAKLNDSAGPVSGTGVDGDIGWISASYSATDPSGVKVASGNYVSVYKRINGEWKIVRDIWNSDKPAAPVPAAATAPKS
jgi:ketosteroid isomerase-like protein